MDIKMAFDIDDVITETSRPLLETIEKYGEGIDFNDPRTSKKEILRGRAATSEVKEFFKKYGTEFCKIAKLKQGADIVIRELKTRGVIIYLITSRDERLMPGVTQATIDYLAEKDIPYDQLHVGVHNKKELCEKLGIICLTDDSIDTCKSLIDSKTKPILFTTEVNGEFCAEGIQRVADWNELADVLIQILEKQNSRLESNER